MTTKADEIKALAKIRKIVEEMGENSYIGTAFDGCFEMAEGNIENDFGDSARWYIDRTHELEEKIRTNEGEAQKKVKELEAEINSMKVRAEKAEELFNFKVEAANKWCAAYNEAADRANKAEDELELAKMEIIRLKARLFDLIDK